MAFVPVPQVMKVVPEYVYPGGNFAYNTFYVAAESEVVLGSLEDVVGAVDGWFSEFADLFVANTVKLTRITATDLTEAGGLQYTLDLGAGVPGANVGAVLPANVTIATSFRTGFSGRSNRGRSYWVGLTEGMVTGDFVLDVQAEGIRQAWADLGAALTTLSYTHVVVSYVSNGVPRVTPQIRPVTEYLMVDTRVDTQRRRLT